MLCDWKTVNDFLEVLQRSAEYCSQGECLINQAATGVWYRARQCGCQRIERRFAIGRDTDVCLANCYFAKPVSGELLRGPIFTAHRVARA